MLNLLTDVPGIAVGQADDPRLASGVTVVLFERPATAAVAVVGGAPAGRDAECLAPDRAVERVDAMVLSGGSGFGLDSGSGAQAWLRARGRGLPVGALRVPIVPTAVLFDLLNGGDKDWGRYPPYRELAFAACETARSGPFALGTAGAGFGATTVDLKGGLGSASATTSGGHVVGALAAVNAIGSAVIDGGPHFWAAPYERDGEFGGLGWPDRFDGVARRPDWKGATPATTLAVVATDARLTKAEASRMAAMAAGGLARSLRLAAAPMDGDTVFAASTRRRLLHGLDDLTELGSLAADTLARAVARGVHAATALPCLPALQSWREKQEQSIAG